MNKETQRLMEIAGIKEGNKKFLTNESFSETKPVEEMKKDNDDFIVFELDQKDFKPGHNDDTLYRLG